MATWQQMLQQDQHPRDYFQAFAFDSWMNVANAMMGFFSSAKDFKTMRTEAVHTRGAGPYLVMGTLLYEEWGPILYELFARVISYEGWPASQTKGLSYLP